MCCQAAASWAEGGRLPQKGAAWPAPASQPHAGGPGRCGFSYCMSDLGSIHQWHFSLILSLSFSLSIVVDKPAQQQNGGHPHRPYDFAGCINSLGIVLSCGQSLYNVPSWPARLSRCCCGFVNALYLPSLMTFFKLACRCCFMHAFSMSISQSIKP